MLENWQSQFSNIHKKLLTFNLLISILLCKRYRNRLRNDIYLAAALFLFPLYTQTSMLRGDACATRCKRRS